MVRIPWQIFGQGEMNCVLNLFGVCKSKCIEPSQLNTCFIVVRIDYSNNCSMKRKKSNKKIEQL